MKIKAYSDGDLEILIGQKWKPMDRALAKSYKELATEAKLAGRRAIAAGGFGTRWQNTLRSKDYHDGPLDGAVYVWHKIPHAVAFEQGATIRGKSGKLKKLWIPLDTTPDHMGQFKTTPRRLSERGIMLFPKRIGGKVYLLGAFGMTRAAAKKDRNRITPGMLKRGASGGGKRKVVKAVPLFVGVDTITLKKRFGVRDAVRKVGRELPALYVKNFKDD